MANSLFQDREAFAASMPLPSPTDTAYATPVPSLSRRSSRYSSASPPPSSPLPPPPFSPDGFSTFEDSPPREDSLPITDPRRFTPTLHASLVSEILSLRRELDTKHKFIEDLESHIVSAKSEKDSLAARLAQSNKEHKNVKHQLKQIEDGTISALEELARERDEAREANQDLRAKVEQFQKRIKTQEDESLRVHQEWQTDKEHWDHEKRGLERRVHATETRLRIILNELEAQQQNHNDHDSDAEDNRDSGVGNESDTASIGSMSRKTSLNRGMRHSRNMSSSSHRSIGRSYRFSTISGTGSDGYTKLNGMSLADELKFDEEEEEELEYLEDSDDYPEHEARARRAMESRASSIYPDEKAKRILGLTNGDTKAPQSEASEGNPSMSFDSAVAREDYGKSRQHSVPTPDFIPTNVISRHEPITLAHEEKRPASPIKRPASPTKRPASPVKRPVSPTKRASSPLKIAPVYVDSGIQYSPPSSPTIPASPEPPMKSSEPINSVMDIEANQRRKRVPSAPNLRQSAEQQKKVSVMVSTSSQTVEPPLSPPATPRISNPPSPKSPTHSIFKVETATVSTQTDFVDPPSHPPPSPPRSATPPPIPKRIRPPSPIPIPSIAIHPPVSTPSSPKEPRLPPGTKNAGSQTAFPTLVSMQDASMQTEAIKTDKRLAKLPPHLLPSAIRSRSGTPEPGQERPVVAGIDPKKLSEKMLGKSPVASRTGNTAAALRQQIESETEDRYPGNNDNGPLVRARMDQNDIADIIRRPFRTSSLFAGFTGPSSDEEDLEEDISEDDLPGPSAVAVKGRVMKHPRAMANPPTPVPEEKEVVHKPRDIDSQKRLSRELSPHRLSLEKPAKVSKPVRTNGVGRQSSIRRSAMIQNGSAYQRPRSPSLGSSNDPEISRLLTKPPFPVPNRSSSRRTLGTSKSEGSQSPTPSSGAAFSNRFGGNLRNQRHSRNDSLRKVRSAAVIPRAGRMNGRPRSRSPPLPSPSLDSPSVPPLPQDGLTSPQFPFFAHRHQPSTNTSHTAATSAASSVQSTSVVDAIAATMVGEWMWKYVRRRKSFTVSESPHDIKAGEEGSGGARHKRWVWLSPYERSVMWSSKQPTSGTALLGKNGRKLTVQSVLDVQDNTPLPKGPAGQTAFNRSILILTPQRALKFTAVSRERHYLWLTALSFLAHSINSSQEVPALPSVPPPIPPRDPERTQERTATLRRAHIRDSVRLAKDKTNPVLQRQFSGPAGGPIHEYGHDNWDQPLPDIADAPSIPRFGHGRKRSSTGPSAPPPTIYRSFSHNPVPSIYSSGSSDMYGPGPSIPPSVPSTVYNPSIVVTSGRTSEASSRAGHNFFDAMGTMRMEAFIDRVEPRLSEDTSVAGSSMYNGFKPRVPRVGGGGGRRRGNPQWGSNGTNEHNQRTGGLYEDFVYDGNADPFKEF